VPRAAADWGGLFCTARGNRWGRPPHTGVPEIGDHPHRLPRDAV